MIIGMPTTSYPRSHADVAGDFVRSMAHALVRRGHSVEVIAPEPREPTRPFDEPGIRVTFVPYMRPRELATTFYGAGVVDNVRLERSAPLGLFTFPPALTMSVSRRIRRWDGVISHWALPSAIAVGLAGARAPHVAVLHSADVHLLSRLPSRGLWARAIERSATSLAFSAPYLAARFETCLGRPPRIPVDVAPMGFDPEGPGPEPREKMRERLGLRGFVVLAMGRLVPIKGVDRLIDACRTLDVTLVIAGSGPEEAALRVRSEGGRVRFVGTIRGDDKRDLLRSADAFVLASRTLASDRAEGAPVSLLEAMGAGLPIVATDTGGVAATIGDAGLVVSDDTDALRAAIERLRVDPALRRELSGRSLSRSWSATWDARIGTFESRLSGPGPRSSDA